jgi:TnpA family transposase
VVLLQKIRRAGYCCDSQIGYQSTLPLAKEWGGGEVASADGMRFVTPTRTINAGPNRKYFGSSRGITWYNFVSDQFSGFHGIVVPGLAGAFEQKLTVSTKSGYAKFL